MTLWGSRWPQGGSESLPRPAHDALFPSSPYRPPTPEPFLLPTLCQGNRQMHPDLKSWHFDILNGYLSVLLWITWKLENGWKFPSSGSCLKTMEHCVAIKRKIPKSNRRLSTIDICHTNSINLDFFIYQMRVWFPLIPVVSSRDPSRQKGEGLQLITVCQSTAISCCWLGIKVTRN